MTFIISEEEKRRFSNLAAQALVMRMYNQGQIDKKTCDSAIKKLEVQEEERRKNSILIPKEG